MNTIKYVQLSDSQSEAGCDEVGRGCLAGPVVAASVILPPNFNLTFINDSKKLTEKKRKELGIMIKKEAVCFAIAEVSPLVIDEINILQSSILAMHKALDQLIVRPDYIIVDGNKFNPYRTIPHTTVIKGDSKYANIAAASILAKNYRDDLMTQLHEEFPMYGWNKNAGYPTQLHRAGIEQFGITKYHRKTFKLLKTKNPLLFEID